jgi:PAS domain-containing protein
MLGRAPITIPFSTEAMKSNLLRLQNEWATVRASRDRDAIYRYLAAIFELVLWWDQESKAVNRARRALRLLGYSSVREPEPFAAVILCTADRDQVDERTRSKWSRALRYAAEFKDLDEPLRDFIKRKGGINSCASRFGRCLGTRADRACGVVTGLRQA